VLPPVDALFAIDVTWAEAVTAIGTALTALILFGTALTIYLQLTETERTRLATLVTDLTRRWDEPLLRRARLEFSFLTSEELLQIVVLSYANPRGPEDEIYLRLQALPNFFEYLGVLEADTKGVPLELINVLWRGSILSTWRRWEPTIEWIREKAGIRTPYASFEHLADKIRLMPEHRVSAGREPATQATGRAEHRSGQIQESFVLHSNETGNRWNRGRILGVLAAVFTVSALWGVLKRVIRPYWRS
jgi:hypothetical protein